MWKLIISALIWCFICYSILVIVEVTGKYMNTVGLHKFHYVTMETVNLPGTDTTIYEYNRSRYAPQASL